ncbi:MAG: hypothetical protein AB1597_06325 [Chloroflexota bacterium]
MDTQSVLMIGLLLVLFILGVYVIPNWRFKRTARQVVAAFREKGAVTPSGAKTLEDLGFQTRRSFMEQLLKGRDFRMYALQAMLKGDVVRVTEDGRFYLVEDKLPPAFR